MEFDLIGDPYDPVEGPHVAVHSCNGTDLSEEQCVVAHTDVPSLNDTGAHTVSVVYGGACQVGSCSAHVSVLTVVCRISKFLSMAKFSW